MPSIRQRLADKLNAQLEAQELPYRVAPTDIQRIYAGYWQRSQGAAIWAADARHVDSPGARMTILGWDTMTNCVRMPSALYRGYYDWSFDVNR
jgi:hypothetical protein